MNTKRFLILAVAILSIAILLLFLYKHKAHLLAEIEITNSNEAKVLKVVKEQLFIPKYDTLASFSEKEFIWLGVNESVELWIRDIESPDTTRYTKYWNEFAGSDLAIGDRGFTDHYSNRSDIEIAFKFGPILYDLFSYHIFVVKEIDNYFLVTRSYFRHNRFTYKAYAILSKERIDRLFSILDIRTKIPMDTAKTSGYIGVFVDNRNNIQYYLDFQKESIEAENNPKKTKEYLSLFNYLDQEIEWKVTYDLFSIPPQ